MPCRLPYLCLRALRSILCFVGVLGLLTVAGCARPQVDLQPPVQAPPTFSLSGEAAVQGRWWEAFGDERLNDLMTTALADNLELAGAWQRLRAARAVSRRAGADLWPTLDATADAEAARYESDGDGSGNGSGDDDDNETSEEVRLGLVARYEVDLWGRIGDTARAEALRAEATREDYHATALTLTAEVARSWFALLAASQRSALLQEQVDANEQVLELIRARFSLGQTRAVDVLRQQQLVAGERRLLANEQARMAVARHRLAVLAGRAPKQLDIPGAADVALPEMPALPATGLPAALVQRRPDVRATHARLLAADSDLAAAVANQYPRLSLMASIETVQDDATQLFNNWLGTLAAGIVAPIIDGGSRRAEVARTEAVTRERLAAWGQSMLLAFAEVEDALVRERFDALALGHLDAQVELAQSAAKRLRTQYFNGISPYIDVLTAQTELQRLQRERITAYRELLDVRVALYGALAGPVASVDQNNPRDDNANE